MGGGIKSKFRFPVPGRSSKKQQAPAASVPGPLSKAQRILGADGINIGPSRLTADPGRSWETGSTGGISISISESSASQTAHDIGFEKEHGRRALWEEESAIIPRQIASAHGSSRRDLATGRAAFGVGNESRDNITNISIRGRRLSSSTIDTHYDSAKMPLAISQQTSNSAMAKGLPTKVSELLDMDGSLAGTQTGTKKKKKPAKLDLSRLRPKGHKDRNRNAPNVEPVLGNNYIMRSPSFMARTPELPIISSSTAEERQKTPRKLTKQPIMRESPRSKGITEPAGLHQLYHHYEQMSFQSEDPLEEVERTHTTPYSERSSNNPRPASTFTHSLIAPLPLPLSRNQDNNWSHSRNNSHDSRITASITDSSGGLQVNPASRKDYAGSVSSRHTRTSKASPSSKSLLESDRLQSSVLSLSDSSDDEAIEPTSSAPSSRRESLTHEIVLDYSNTSKVQQNLNHLHGPIGPRKFTPSLNQVDEHLAVKPAPRAQTSRSPSNNTLRSSQSSMSTLTSPHLLSPSASGSRLSSRSNETIDTLGSPHQPGYGVQEARAVSFVPLVSTVEAASNVSISEGAHHLDRVLRQNSTATSRISHSSDQPTPPLSPNSVEFYMPSRESLQGQAMGSGSSEAHNARLMAVTRQEEMLLAALRQKRAKMRETVIPEAGEDGKSRTGRSNRGNLGNAQKSSTNKTATVTASSVKPWPKRASSLFMGGSRENLRHDQLNAARKELRDADIPSAMSCSDATERTSTSATGSTASTTFDSRNDRILLYVDQHTDGTNTADSSVYLSDDYMEDSDGEDLIANERRTSRMQSRRDSASDAARGHRTSSANGRRESSNYSGQSRKGSLPTHSLTAPLKGYRLQDVPEVEVQPEYNEDVDADDLDEGIDGFPQPPMPPPSWPLPPRPGKSATKSNSPSTSAHFLHPLSAVHQAPLPERKTGHLKNERSMVRLSAVGYSNSPMPIWGDDD